jgi:hypothetical protein
LKQSLGEISYFGRDGMHCIGDRFPDFVFSVAEENAARTKRNFFWSNYHEYIKDELVSHKRVQPFRRNGGKRQWGDALYGFKELRTPTTRTGNKMTVPITFRVPLKAAAPAPESSVVVVVSFFTVTGSPVCGSYCT